MGNIKRLDIVPWMNLELARSPRNADECKLKPIDALPLEFGLHRPIDGVYLRHDWIVYDGYSLWNLWAGDQIRRLQRRAKYMENRLYLAIVIYGDRQFVTTMTRDFEPIEHCPKPWEIKACQRVRHRLSTRDRRWLDYWQGFRSDLSVRLYRWKYYKDLWDRDRHLQIRKESAALKKLNLP